MSSYLLSLFSARWNYPGFFWLLVPVFILLGVSVKWRKRSIGAVALRCLAVALLVLVLAYPVEIESSASEELPVLFDVSASIAPGARRAMIRALQDFQGEGEGELRIYPFGRSVLETPVAAVAALDEDVLEAKIEAAAGAVDRGESDLAGALRAVVSRTSGSSVILLSDGFETTGDVRQAARFAAAKGVRVYPLIPDEESFHQAKMSIASLYAPVTAKAGERLEVRASVRNALAEESTAELQLWLDQDKLFSSPVTVSGQSEKVVTVMTPLLTGGLRRIRAVLAARDKESKAAEETKRWVSVKEKEKILLVSGTEEDEKVIKDLIRFKGYGLEDVIADGRREVPKDFTNYASVVLNNAAKSQLPGDFLANLRRFVESGGGLLVLGGDRSFALGGYINTSLEEISPLKFVPPRTEKRRLITAVVLLIDKSGSMAEQNKIQSAKLAALMSINALKDEDFISVIGFDHAPFVIIDLKKVDEVKPQAPRRLENLTAAGQTNLLPALAAARQKLSNSAASRKHVIVLSDGKFPLSDAPYIDEINQLRKDGVTVSAVALGFEADVPFMKLLSQHGRGAFYHTLDPSQLPQVFVQDIKVATGEKTMKEAQEYPVGIGPGGMVSASPAQFPALRGFVETLPKKGSTLELITRSEGQVFPVLASWIYGKGKVIAFTSDANGRWSLPWLRWPGFFGFWSDIVEKIKDRSGRKGGEIDFDLRYSINRKSLLLDLSIFDEHLQTGAAPRISGELLAPGGEKKEVIFQQARKGRFEGVLADAEPGDYKIDLTYGSLKLPPLAISIGGEAFGEIPGRGIQVQNLAQAAYLTGGIVNPLRAQVYANKRISETARPLYAPLVLLAFALILAEAFVREVGATGLIALFQRRKGAGADARRVKGRYYDAKRRALY